MKNSFVKISLAVLAISAIGLAGCGKKEEARNRIAIVGSSTVFPFASVVAEQFAATTGSQVPKVESTGTGGGMKIFCTSKGLAGVDITNASRPMKKSEWDECQKNGINEIIEFKIGYDGIVIADSKTGSDLNVNRKDLYLALAKQIPVNGKLVDNPNKNWSDVNPALPKIKIEVLGPPPTSGTRDAFAELILEKGAEEIPFLKDLKEKDKDAFKTAATAIREDGAWKDMGENDNLIVQALTNNKEAFGVFGYSFFEENKDRIKAATIDSEIPELHKITDGKYPASRSLYVYVKKANINLIPSIKAYINEFTSAKAAGPTGYLAKRGLIPLKPEELTEQQKITSSLTVMAAPTK